MDRFEPKSLRDLYKSEDNELAYMQRSSYSGFIRRLLSERLMQCPACETVTDPWLIDECNGCGGIWLTEGKTISEIRGHRCIYVNIYPGFEYLRQEKFIPENKLAAKQLRGQFFKNAKGLGCPECSTPLESFPFNYNSNIILDQCPNGHGLWLAPGTEIVRLEDYLFHHNKEAIPVPTGTLLGIFKSFGKLFKRSPKIERRTCPHDQTTLIYLTYEGGIVDFCTGCGGIWNDKDELYKILVTHTIGSSGDPRDAMTMFHVVGT